MLRKIDILMWITTMFIIETSALDTCLPYEADNIFRSFLTGPIFPYVSPEDVHFHLYTRQNPTDPIKLKPKSGNHFTNSQFKIIIHGWIEHGKIDWYLSMIEAYLTKDNYNIIAVDWSKGAAPNYLTASYNVRYVGKYVGKFIADLVQSHSISLDDIHVVGHSLGAHVAGIAGKVVLSLLGRKIGRITALDAARPFFEFPRTCDHKRLLNDDADFVDVVHTDGGIFGFKEPIGDVDFYPNGGSAFQPGCRNITRLADIFCSHKRSHTFFTESINSQIIFAQKCDSWDSYQRGCCVKNRMVPFGEHANRFERGTFYFTTRQTCPFI